MGQTQDWIRRVPLLLGGSALSAACYALTVKAALGLGPLYTVQQGIARHLHITLGHAVMITGSILCVIAVLLRMWPGPGTVALPFVQGAFLDAFLPHTPTAHGLVLRLAVVVLATWFMALGGAIIIRSRVGAAAPDLCMLALSRKTGRSNRAVRLAMEASWVATGWLLGGTIGLGTVITGLLIGPALHFWIERVTPTSSAMTAAPVVSGLELT
ncbi:MAG TPA: hypothetical protein VHC63_12175 [Acidimicrobiales bacterium]|nr:hypothetical protein [Acidimicrobiales bacterium]